MSATACPPTATRQYARAHLFDELLRTSDSTAESIDAYGTEVNTRFEAKKTLFDSSRKTFEALDASRKAEAAKLFKCNKGEPSCGPMPDLKP